MSRAFDVVLWGCTGFTGGLVAEYFAQHAPASIKWTLAGRTVSKLDALKEKLTALNEKCSTIEPIQANITDEASLAAMASATKVILSTAGPFMRCGTPIVKACVENGTHYCDITGESPWVRQLMDQFHDEAVRKKIHIVPTCGFDSIPFDLGAFMVARAAADDGGVTSIKGYARVNGRPSGGTLHTILNLIDVVPLKEMGNPHLMDPVKHRKRSIAPGAKDQSLPSFDKALHTWTNPFVMSGVNTRVVRRSSLLYEDAGKEYGKDFFYAETEIANNGFVAYIKTIFTGLFFLLAIFRIGRFILSKVLPAAGTGPSPAERARSSFRIKFLGQAANGKQYLGAVAGGDPGYTETAKMISNAAICLAQGDTEPSIVGGILTPASSMGNHLITRLKKAGMTFEVNEFEKEN